MLSLLLQPSGLGLGLRLGLGLGLVSLRIVITKGETALRMMHFIIELRLVLCYI